MGEEEQLKKELTALREEKSNLESEVKRYREALEKIFKLKVPEHKDCVAYDIASSALSEGVSE